MNNLHSSQVPGPSRPNVQQNSTSKPTQPRSFAEALGNRPKPTSTNKGINLFQSVTRECGIQCRFLDETTIEDYLTNCAELVQPENIIAASKCDRMAKIFFTNEDHANLVVAHGLAVKGNFLDCSLIGKPTTSIIISGVPPFITNENLEAQLRMFGQVVSGIRYIPLGTKNKALSHIKSFRRSARIRLDHGTELPYTLMIPHDTEIYTIYLSSDSKLRCDFCRKIGHAEKFCRTRLAQERSMKAPPAAPKPTEVPKVTKPTTATTSTKTAKPTGWEKLSVENFNWPDEFEASESLATTQNDDNAQNPSQASDPSSQNAAPTAPTDTDPLIGNAQPERDDDEQTMDFDSGGDDEDDDYDVASTISDNESLPDSQQKTLFDQNECERFLNQLRSIRKVYEKASEITDNIPKMIKSLQRYKRVKELSQADNIRIKRVISKLKNK